MKKTLLQEVKAMNKIAGTQLTKEQEIALIRERLQQLNELEFGTQKAFDSYQRQHNMRGDTQVTVAGKKMSVNQAAKQSKDPNVKGTATSVKGKSAPTSKPKKLSGSDLKSSAEKDAENHKNHKWTKAIDTKKLSKEMNSIVDEDGDQILDSGEKKDVLNVIKNLPKLVKDLDGDDQDKSIAAAQELKNCSASFITQLPKHKRKEYEPLDRGIIHIAAAGDEYNSKWAKKGVKMISDFLKSRK